MMRNIAFLSLLLLLVACGSHNQVKTASGAPSSSSPRLGSYLLAGDSVVVPPFAVEVKLSDKANRQLAARKETLVVAAYLKGIPGWNSPAHRDKDGGMRVAEAHVELRTGRVARFTGVKFARQVYDQLANKDLMLLVNVYSGRKSTDDNLLDCTIVQARVSEVAGQTCLVTGHLIEGD